MQKYTWIYFLFIFIGFVACGDEKEINDKDTNSTTSENNKFDYPKREAQKIINDWVDSTTLKIDLPKINEQQIAENLFLFYSKRDFLPAWNQEKPKELLGLVKNIAGEGLNPESYPIDSIEYLLKEIKDNRDPIKGAKLDILLSATYLKLADVIATGKVKAGNFNKSWHIKPEAPDTLYTHLQQSLTRKNIDASLEYFRPDYVQYEQLQEKLLKYRTIISNGSWATIPEGQTLETGDSSQRVELVKKRLFISGDLNEEPGENGAMIFNLSLVEAVNSFQKRHGLTVQPKINRSMIEAMNISAEQRLKQIMLNMDRLRWFSSGGMPETYVLVNIPEYQLRVFENGEETKRMKVVVGETMNSTPIFSDVIEYVVFSPYWNVPTSIAEEELWPEARKNLSYLENRNYEVLNGWTKDADIIPPNEIDWEDLDQYRIRQKPGPWNSLGRVKFMFPNDFAIYLHDTPADQLFDKQHRAFSHGCIRIEEPAWFADWLFDQFSRDQVESKMNDQKREVVSLKEHIPVYIFYLTAFVDEEGRMNFRKDLYELDKNLTSEFDYIEL